MPIALVCITVKTVRQLVQEPLTAPPKQLSRFPHYAMTQNKCIGHHVRLSFVSLVQLREMSLVATHVLTYVQRPKRGHYSK